MKQKGTKNQISAPLHWWGKTLPLESLLNYSECHMCRYMYLIKNQESVVAHPCAILDSPLVLANPSEIFTGAIHTIAQN